MRPWYWNNVKYWRTAYLFYLPFTMYGMYKLTLKAMEWHAQHSTVELEVFEIDLDED